MAKQKQFRQGDVFWVRVPKAPASLKPVDPVNGRHILALGEVTGHHHSFDATKGTLCLDEGGTTYMTIEELTEVQHQEHAAIPVEPGVYRVVRQREYAGPERQSWVGD